MLTGSWAMNAILILDKEANRKKTKTGTAVIP